MSNPFVMDKKNLEILKDHMSNVKWMVAQAGIEFETTPEFLREILPPCFDMPDKPMGSVAIGKWRGNICGDFDCAIIDFQCKYKGQAGSMMLALYLETDMPIALGRECWGEAKKLGKCELYPCGKDMFACVSRGGKRIIEINAVWDKEYEPFEESVYGFEINAEMDEYGASLVYDPRILTKKFNFKRLVKKEGNGTLKFSGTERDPLDAIPIVSVGRAFYTEHWNNSEMVTIDIDPDREKYVPFIFGQKYDNMNLYPIPERVKDF
ncbi:MAG: acetoacetate decarboxylase family protein [Lachnospiraceae bacterium]|nr:acetoacetate decarboxylase family protein [Lachnospiraceae bacterium]